jgi:hypothetical protein
MTTKLNWEYQHNGEHSGEYHAEHNGHRIRAVRDDHPENPFDNWDGTWPMLVRSERGAKPTLYDKTNGPRVDDPLNRISDAQLVHDQITIAKLLDTTIEAVTQYSDDFDGSEGQVKYSRDADFLRTEFQNILDDGREDAKLELYAQLFEIAGVKAHCGMSTGHSQGDWAEVLVVATPEAIKEFGCAEVTDDDLKAQVKLYGAWAWGDVYGYVIEKPIEQPAACANCGSTDNDGSDVCADCEGDIEDVEPEYEEIEGGSCWGYYGSDFDESGLEEAALEACPDEEKVDA